jgi:tetratricopeptide (TPR) repeat protein
VRLQGPFILLWAYGTMSHRAMSAAQPDGDPASLYMRGLVALRAGETHDAIELLRNALIHRADHIGIHRNLVRALLAAHRPAEAVRQADAALVRQPDDAELHFARGTALNALGRSAEAKAALSRAVVLAPGHAPSWLNLGNACVDLDDLESAARHCLTALRLAPDLPEAGVSLGYILTAQGRLAEAVAACEAVIARHPDCAPAHWNLAVATLLAGDLPRGFAAYEWRTRNDRFRHDFIDLPGPIWDGSDPAGRTILVHAEQGFGDTIQFARYLPDIADRGGRAIFACDRALVGLFQPMSGVQVVAKDQKLPPYDAWIDQMSLPLAFATDLASIPAASGYLKADAGRVAAWDAMLPAGRRVGLAWAGNKLHTNDRRRSVPPEALAPLLACPGIALVNLQVGDNASAVAALPDLTPLLTDYAETAALIACLDLVVCVDTSVAHLAGALGIPAWVMLPHAPDWRWMLTRTDSPWYRAVRLFRQPRPGDWHSVVAAVVAALGQRRDD